MSSFKEKLQQAIQELGISLSEEQVSLLEKYKKILQEWNTRMNLTAIDDDEAMLWKHFIDSLMCTRYVEFTPGMRIIDVGTGAGFPGIPLKVWQPGLKMVLLDSVKKKVNFLNEVIKQLDLTECVAIWSRAEELGHQENYRDSFDRVVARAVARLNILIEYCFPFVKVGGIFVAYKGVEGRSELENAIKAIGILGGEVENVYETVLGPGQEKRTIIVIKKIVPTPKGYPRRVGIAEKRPL
ncbi:MAG: 16S rRNA (guanine(527)-N(7))-methyltransferase RsmG [Firmicutes bacterium]|nr:16S rRNA (guanine(527)-N(7))-methyltransferase RsmG [Bacillota bacterium]